MNKQNVVLLGGSNSVMIRGLQKGIRDGIDMHNKTYPNEQLVFHNFSLGGCTSIQNLYEVIRNKKILQSAKLIISESNINEMQHHFHEYQKLEYSLIFRNLMWLHKELYAFKTKVLILVLPYPYEDYHVIDQMYTKICIDFGFNYINMQDYYNKNFLVDFGKRIDPHHQQASIMKELGRNIIKNIDYFGVSKRAIYNDNPVFRICKPCDMELINGCLEKYIAKNSVFHESVYRVREAQLLFGEEFDNSLLIGIHNWNTTINWTENFLPPSNYEEEVRIFSSLLIVGLIKEISKEFRISNQFIEIQDTNFIISKNSIVKLNNTSLFSEYHSGVYTWEKNTKLLTYSDLIALFLASNTGNYHIDFCVDRLMNNNFDFDSYEYNFNHIIPPIEIYKEIIDEYCLAMDSKKLAPLHNQIMIANNEKQKLINEKSNLQTQINQLQNTLNTLPIKKQQLEISNLEQDLINKKLQTKQLERQLGAVSNNAVVSNGNKITIIHPNSAKSRIQNQLSYKLGHAMIVNSKSLLGYIRMPFVLSYIKDKHKQEQKIYQEKIKKDPSLKLPPLESYPDYQEALKEKECFTYKLGEALIRANNNWYGGGYIKLWFEIRKLKKI
ncbi:hypothetical protein [Campylobacter coli]|uniref:hypothetical protein n=1 Tax=Campylobacter coli TaxID=195 RepID=UPI000AF748B9|nr:hypothetical protein [Campylobacter coli]